MVNWKMELMSGLTVSLMTEEHVTIMQTTLQQSYFEENLQGPLHVASIDPELFQIPLFLAFLIHGIRIHQNEFAAHTNARLHRHQYQIFGDHSSGPSPSAAHPLAGPQCIAYV